MGLENEIRQSVVGEGGAEAARIRQVMNIGQRDKDTGEDIHGIQPSVLLPDRTQSSVC